MFACSFADMRAVGLLDLKVHGEMLGKAGNREKLRTLEKVVRSPHDLRAFVGLFEGEDANRPCSASSPGLQSRAQQCVNP